MTDRELPEQVENALDREPSIDVSDIDVTVDGVLEVSVPLPARPEAKMRRVEIQESAKARTAA